MRDLLSERRVEPRALTAALVDIIDERTDMCKRAVLEDLSPSGACVYFDRKLDIGTEVTLTLGDVTLIGTITHREKCDGGYRMGVQFKSGKWPQPIGSPMHWFDPNGDVRT